MPVSLGKILVMQPDKDKDTRKIQLALARAEGASGLLLPEAFAELDLSLEELRVAEEELRQQNEELSETRERVERERQRYQELFDFAPDAYFVTDLDGIIQEANLAAATLLGVTARRLAGKPLALFVAPEARFRFRSFLNQKSRANTDTPWGTILRPRRGKDVLVSISLGTAQTMHGLPASLRWLVRERRPQEIEMEMLLASAPVGMALLTPDFRYVHVNQELARINGMDMAEHRGQYVRRVVGTQTWHHLEPFLERVLAGEIIQDEEISTPLPADPNEVGHFRLSCYPIRSGDEIQSIGTFVQDITVRRNTQQQQERELVHNRRIADTLQTALMQTVSENAFPGLSVSTLYKAASQEASIGGDFYDAFQISNGRVALIVGDVSGKGLSAATHIAEVKYTLRAFLRETQQPGQALTRLNNAICEAQREDDWGNASLVVLALAIIDPVTGTVTYASAGAEPMLMLMGASDPVTEHGRRSGLMLGVAPDQSYEETTLMLPPGALLLMATDGITEARCEGVMLGLDGLKRLALDALHHSEIGEISRAILDNSRAYSGGHLADDACILLVRRRA
jgi:PAS domain S-box-containing protein